MTKTRRYCRIEGCTKIVKSQGLCQRHGAKTRLCKVDGCPKQAQGNFDGMCKSHFKQSRVDLKETMVIPSTVPPPPSGQSVYDHIIPASIAFRSTDEKELMPLVAHLKQGFDENRPRGWHRNDERRARGLWPVAKAAVQLQGWERELVWMEICILSGNSQASFRHLARAWGRDKGFHMVLAQFICERRGNVERKQRPKGSAQRGGANAFPEDFMNDILSFEDMDCMIEGMLGAESSDVDSESEGHGGGTATLQGQQQQQQTENVCSSHAQVVPHHQEGVHSYQDEKQQVAVAAAAAAATSAAAAHVVYSSVAHHHVAREAQSLVAHEQQQHEAADGYVDPLDVHLLMPLVHATEQQPAPTVTKQV